MKTQSKKILWAINMIKLNGINAWIEWKAGVASHDIYYDVDGRPYNKNFENKIIHVVSTYGNFPAVKWDYID